MRMKTVEGWFAYARRKPLYAVVARSYRRTRVIVVCGTSPYASVIVLHVLSTWSP